MATKTYKGVPIPTSARGLELYSGMKGVGAAAQDILRQLKRDITELQERGKAIAARYDSWDGDDGDAVKDMAKLIGEIYKAGVYEKMIEHSEFGATDTEPRYHIGQALVDTAKIMMGCADYYMPELADWI